MRGPRKTHSQNTVGIRAIKRAIADGKEQRR